MMFRLQHFDGRRIVGGQEGQPAQIVEEVGQPETSDGDRHDYVRLRMLRLKGRDSSSVNGTAKWKITMNRPIYPQSPFKRRR